MTAKEVLKQLESWGTAQNRKIYARHGVSGIVYGVSFAKLNALAKKIKKDHKLALELWKSGVSDARYLAVIIADPEMANEADINAWGTSSSTYGSCDTVSSYIVKTKFAKIKGEEWIKSDNEWIGRTGWNLIGGLAGAENELTDDYFLKKLALIEKTIHSSKNYTRHAMNMVVIRIGLRNATLEKAAREAAKRIGKVHVDHGETDCKTPEIIPYIERTKARYASRPKKSVKGMKAAPAAKKSGTKKSASKSSGK